MLTTIDRIYILDVRASAILTSSYVAATIIGPTATGVYKRRVADYNQLKIIADFTIGSLTDCDIQVEYSEDGTTYSQESFGAVTTNEEIRYLAHHTLAGTGIYEINLPINTNFIKISAIGNGTATSSLLAIDVVLAKR
jgi:hypothetical protein